MAGLDVESEAKVPEALTSLMAGRTCLTIRTTSAPLPTPT